MTPALGILLALLLQGSPPSPAVAPPASLQFGRFGTLPLHRPAGPPSQVVLLLSGAMDSPETAKMAGALASWGALVVVVDAQHYVATTEKSGANCSYPAADLETLSHFAEQKLELPRYIPPLLVGDATGATLAYATLAQAPPSTFQGAVTVGFCPVIQVKRPFCPGNDLHADRKWAGTGIKLEPATRLESPWIVLDGPACPEGSAKEFLAPILTARLLSTPAPGPPAEGSILLRQAFDSFGATRQKEAATAAARGDLQDLPLVEIPAEGAAKDAFAVILSGDGGWVGLDRKIGRRLADLAVPVVGLDALTYFWTPRDPEGTAHDLARILEHYFQAWGKRQAILVGYSQGADVLPFMVSRLTPELRARISLVALVGPDKDATFDFNFGGWMSDRPKRPDLPVLPEIPRLQGSPVLCVYANAEKDSPCTRLPPGAAIRLGVPGGHGFNRDVNIITDRILKEAGLRPKNAPAPEGAPKPKRG